MPNQLLFPQPLFMPHAASENRDARVRTVHLYVFDGFADWEPSFAVAGINTPDFQREPGQWRVKTVGDSTEPVRSMGGLTVVPDMALDALTPEDSALLLLPGGPGWDRGEHLDAARKGEEFLQARVPVAAICGATAGLARLGVLDQRRHTSNAIAYLKGTGYQGTDRYEDEPAFNDHGLITAGGMAPLEFAREIFQQLRIYNDDALEAWYALYKTGRSEHFAKLQHVAAA